MSFIFNPTGPDFVGPSHMYALYRNWNSNKYYTVQLNALMLKSKWKCNKQNNVLVIINKKTSLNFKEHVQIEHDNVAVTDILVVKIHE